MFYRNSTLFKFVASILVIGAIMVYIFFNSRVFIKGPQISVSFPENGQLIEEKLIYVTGQAVNSDFISINARVITIDPKGYFRVPYLMTDGKNVIEIKVRDRFNRQDVKTIEVVYNEDPDFLRRIEEITNKDNGDAEVDDATDDDAGEVVDENDEEI